jgi:hypothetical protein
MRRQFNLAGALNDRRNFSHVKTQGSCTLLKGHWQDQTVSVVATESVRSRVDEVSELRGVSEESESMTTHKKNEL